MRFLGLLFLIFFVLPWVFRWALRFYVAKKINEAQNRQNQSQYTSRKDGKINVDYVPPKNQERFKGGDYVDYEEVK
jgi:hypothetical protein